MSQFVSTQPFLVCLVGWSGTEVSRSHMSFSDTCNSCGCEEFQDLDSTIADASREVENFDRIPGGNLHWPFLAFKR